LNIFYLHGFASSARSSKAAFFAGKLRELGIELHTPDFNEPDFSTLTISRMVGQVGKAIEELSGPVVLIGSSLGAFVAVQVALKHPARVERMVLLAPALDFGGNRMRSLGDTGIDEWKRTGKLDVFHYAYGRMMPVHYELYADARRHDCIDAALAMPIQVFQGRRDDAVDPDVVGRWSRARPNVELHMLDDDHQLTASVGLIWEEMRRFLGLGVGPSAGV
jgi:pimeloyl-ACP methyl ester carboxylesterase